MAHYGMLRDYRFENAAEDIRGSSLYGLNDEKLGKIDDVIFDHSTGLIRYAVVDTGGWLSTKKFLVPVDRLRASSRHKDDFQADLNRQQIENFPPYSEKDLDSEENWGRYEHAYRSQWKEDPVMHRAETDRNITPTTQQMQGNIESQRAADAAHGHPRTGWATGSEVSREPLSPQERRQEEADIAAAEADTGRVVPAGVNTVMIQNSAAGIGGRWDTFQARLRERRKEAVTGCRTCGVAVQSDRDTAADLKKAV